MARPAAERLHLTCETCGKHYDKAPYERRKHDYCSQECYHRGKAKHRPGRTVLHFECEHCGKPVERFKGRETEHVFCSRDCYWRSDFHKQTVAAANAARNEVAKVTEPCAHCGKPVTRYASSRGKSLYCRVPQLGATESTEATAHSGRVHPRICWDGLSRRNEDRTRLRASQGYARRPWAPAPRRRERSSHQRRPR